MPQTTDNPDRNFSADPHDTDADALRLLLKRSEVADPPDKGVEERTGRIIAGAMLAPAKRRTVSLTEAAEYRRIAQNFEAETDRTEDAQLRTAMFRIARTRRILATRLERLQNMRDAAQKPATR
jgi:hypothetical protein